MTFAEIMLIAIGVWFCGMILILYCIDEESARRYHLFLLGLIDKEDRL